MSDQLYGYDPNAVAEESPFDELPKFDSYLGRKGATRSFTFQSGDTNAKLEFTVTEGPAGTKGRKATLAVPVQPEYFTIVNKERVAMTSEADKQREWGQWTAIIATIQRVLGLDKPDLEVLRSGEAVLAWLQGGEGAYVSFGGGSRNGYGEVTCGRRATGQRFIALRAATANVRDRKTGLEVPGLTYEAQARAAIEKAASK